MKTKRIIGIVIAIVMLAVMIPASAAGTLKQRAQERRITPIAGDGVTLTYNEEAFALSLAPYFGLYRVESARTLELKAAFEEGWTYNPRYSAFFREHEHTETNLPDGSIRFTIAFEAGDLLTEDELLTVGIYASPASLPKLEINASVPFSQIGKNEYVEASFVLTLGTKQFPGGDYEGAGSIKGRGNTSWGQPKKPYTIKLDSKASLLGIPKTKKYAIIPSYSDDSLLRNYMTYKAALGYSGIGYVPKCEFVEVYLNGTYNGVYLLVERVSIENNKINITEASAEDLTGGYLIEKDIDGKIDYSADQWFNAPYWANQSRDYFVLKEPEPEEPQLLQQMLSYLTNYMASLHTAVTGGDASAWKQYVDVPSWADMMILQEIAKNIDGNLKTSCYMIKQAQDDKLYMTAPWDFDLAYGSTACTWNNADHTHNDYYDCPDAQSAAGFMVINSSCPWYNHMYDDHEDFRSALKARYAEYRTTAIPEMISLMDSGAAYIANAMPRDEQKWGVRFESGVSYLQNWLKGRIEWLDGEWLPELETVDLDRALNTERGTLHFTSSGSYPFRGVLKDGRLAGVSTNVGADSTESTVSITLAMEAGQTLSFDYKVSSETSYDKFTFSVNGQQKLSADGEKDWQTFTFTASSAGNYSFVWKYAKDYSVASGSDCVWLDEVAWSGDPLTLPGDVDGSGVVDAADALLLLRYTMELIDSLPCPKNADFNGDGTIDAADALLVLRFSMGD